MGVGHVWRHRYQRGVGWGVGSAAPCRLTAGTARRIYRPEGGRRHRQRRFRTEGL